LELDPTPQLYLRGGRALLSAQARR
jgi:hypothetical protein